MTQGNGTGIELPEGRLAILQQANRIAQETATERDNALKEVARLNLLIVEKDVREQALQSLVNDMESRVEKMTAIRDEAVAHRAAYEALFAMQQAQMRAFKIPAMPLIKEAEHEDSDD
jgi:hypothetical protein